MAQHPPPESFSELEVLAFPFRDINVFMLVFFTLVFSWLEFVMRSMGVGGFIISMMAAYAATLMFVGYLFVVFKFTSLGYQNVPKISGSLLDDTKMPILKVLIFVSVLFSIVYLVPIPALRMAVGLAMMLIVPLGTAIIVIEDNLLHALNPLRWGTMFMQLEFDKYFQNYLLVQSVMLLSVWLAVAVDLGFFNLLKMFFVLALILMTFRALGALIHANAPSLDYTVNFDRHISAVQELEALERAASAFMFDVYKLVEANKSEEAWNCVEQRMQQERFRFEPLYFERARTWQGAGLAVKMGQGYIERLMDHADVARAWEVLEFCFDANQGQFRLLSAGDIFELEPHAMTSARKGILAHLYSHFDEDFPHHPRGADALLFAARITAHDLDDFETAGVLVDRLETTYPQMEENRTFQALRAVVRGEG